MVIAICIAVLLERTWNREKAYITLHAPKIPHHLQFQTVLQANGEGVVVAKAGRVMVVEAVDSVIAEDGIDTIEAEEIAATREVAGGKLGK
jgi:hypothetical protein